MNVYQCWYLDLNGYCCRSHNSKWMFIPELGQINNRIHKNLSLDDLRFENPFAKQFELKIDLQRNAIKSSLFYSLKSLFFPVKKPSTVDGMLFATF